MIEMSPSVWLNWSEFRKFVFKKEVVFFGVSSDWAEKTLNQANIQLDCFVDNSPSWQNSVQYNVDVKSPEILKDHRPERVVVITSGAYDTIYPQLVELGYEPGRTFCITPALNNLRVISEIHTHRAKLLVSSPDHKIYSKLDSGKDVGGGLYVYDILDLSCTKVLDGTFHQIADTGDGYFVSEETKGVSRISADFEVLSVFGAEKGMKSHGVAYSRERDLVCLSYTGLDRVAGYQASTEEKLFDLAISDKPDKSGQAKHWINDLCIKDGYLYLSMFSQSGSRLAGIYDGGIRRIDLDDFSNQQILVDTAWMPHTVRFFDENLCYLDSMNGLFWRTNKTVLGEFFGFIRGLAFDGKYYYVGQSESRYFDRLKGIRKHIAMGAGFFMFDEETKAAKFFATPQIRQIHDLCWIE